MDNKEWVRISQTIQIRNKRLKGSRKKTNQTFTFSCYVKGEIQGIQLTKKVK